MDFNVSCWQCIINAALLLLAANGMPVLSRDVLGSFAAWPVDFGIRLKDHQPLLGTSKTWRGVFFSCLVTGLTALLIGLSFRLGALFALLSMSGDLIASFIKRRLGLVESSRFRLLDILPESLLPVLLFSEALNLNVLSGLITVALFFTFEVLISPILFRLHIRKRPY